MSLAQAYGIAPIHINTASGVDVPMPGVTRLAVSQGNRVISQLENGEAWTTYSTIAGQTPRMSFTTRDVSVALATLGISGITIDSDVDDPGLVAYLRKRGRIGTASGSVHRSYTMAQGVLVPRSLSVGHQGNATMTCEALAISADGSSSAFAIADDVSTFPTILTACLDDQYTLYGLTINGATVTGFTGIEINFNAGARTLGAQSDVIDTVAVVPNVRPTIRIRGLDPTWVNTSSSVCDILGESLAHANTSIVLRKRGVALTASEHVAITLAGVVYTDTIADGSAEGDVTCGLMMTTHSPDGTTAPLVLNTGFNIA